MNKVNLIGRLTKDPELRYNNQGIPATSFTIAVNRSYTNSEGQREADFISCVAWRKTAELITKHFKKGSELGLSGRIQTGKYTNDKGQTIYTTDVVVDEITFIGSKKEEKEEPIITGQVTTDVKDPFAEFGEQIEYEQTQLDEYPFDMN